MAEFSAYLPYVRRHRRLEAGKGKGRGNSSGRTQPGPETGKEKKTTPSELWVGDPDKKRRKRVAKYKLYAVEGKVKSSFKKGMRWIKRKCSKIVRGY